MQESKAATHWFLINKGITNADNLQAMFKTQKRNHLNEVLKIKTVSVDTA